ncbi:MAG: response regulator transcription factor [Anaerolineales bacterium]
MPKAEVLLIESSRANAPSFAPALERKGYEVQVHHKLEKAVSSAKKTIPDLLVLDAASMKTSGTRMCRKARAALDGVPIILVSPENTKPDRGSGATLTLIHPFTPRKLLNRVERMLPGDGRFTLEAGPIKLNIAKGRVRCLKKQERLTPKLTKLLEVFLRNPGRLMMRKTLIRKVWQTDYTGDTRTLDVHMSWLRQAIETNPSCPKYFKTIRGMGYRLDIPQDK